MPVDFARPEFLLLLAAIPLMATLVVVAHRARVRSLRTFAGPAALASRSPVRVVLKSALLLLALSCSLTALAGPYVDLRSRAARRLGVELVIGVDISQSMAVRDVAPDRLRAARHFVEELGRQMIGSRVSLVLFAGQGTLRYPPTTDPGILAEVLDNSGRGVKLQQGSSLQSGIESSLGAFASDLEPLRQRAIVLVADGEITVGDLPELERVRERGIHVYAIGVGTPSGGEIPTYDAGDGHFTGYLRGADGIPIISRLDERSLQRHTEQGGGRYWRYTGDEVVVRELANELRSLEAVEPVEDPGKIPDERSAPFIAIAVVAALLERLLSDRRRMPLPRDRQPPQWGRRVPGRARPTTLRPR